MDNQFVVVVVDFIDKGVVDNLEIIQLIYVLETGVDNIIVNVKIDLIDKDVVDQHEKGEVDLIDKDVVDLY